MADFYMMADALRAAITEDAATSMHVGMYEFTFPSTGDFHHWLPDMLDHPDRWRRWISKSDPQALFNQIIQRERISVRSFPPGTMESRSGVYVISDAAEDEVLYIGKCGKSNGTSVAWRIIDHFFPASEKYCKMYNNIKREQNTPWFWDRHIDLGKKLRVLYCDNMQWSLSPERVESELRRIVYERDGDYPRYDGHSGFAKRSRQRY